MKKIVVGSRKRKERAKEIGDFGFPQSNAANSKSFRLERREVKAVAHNIMEIGR